MKKLFNVMAILSFLSIVAFAEDFLAKVTKGALSDSDKGVRLLSIEEEGKVVGGYRFIRYSKYDHYGYGRSYAFVVTSGSNTYESAYDVSREFGFNGFIVAKYRYMSGQKQYYLTYATPSGKTHEFWQHYRNAQEVLKQFKAQY